MANVQLDAGSADVAPKKRRGRRWAVRLWIALLLFLLVTIVGIVAGRHWRRTYPIYRAEAVVTVTPARRPAAGEASQVAVMLDVYRLATAARSDQLLREALGAQPPPKPERVTVHRSALFPDDAAGAGFV